jgi:DnaA regulatory inactivator Hda
MRGTTTKAPPVPASRQLPLGLGHAAAMTRADFLVGDANREAIALIDAWPAWPAPVVVLVGPEGSGKSHLAAVWRSASAATATEAAAVRSTDVETLVAAGAVAVEDLHAGPLDEPALFHLINRAREHGVALLFTSRLAPASLGVALPDLASRLRSAHGVRLGAPDDELLRRVLVKLFADRQLALDPQVIDYLAVRMERSLAAAAAVVDVLDRTALAEGRPITRPFAAAALADRPDFHADEDGSPAADGG